MNLSDHENRLLPYSAHRFLEEVDMSDKFLTAAQADSRLRKFMDAEINARKRKSSIFAIVAGLLLLALTFISSFAVQGKSL
jgi:hypothetical protein